MYNIFDYNLGVIKKRRIIQRLSIILYLQIHQPIDFYRPINFQYSIFNIQHSTYSYRRFRRASLEFKSLEASSCFDHPAPSTLDSRLSTLDFLSTYRPIDLLTYRPIDLSTYRLLLLVYLFYDHANNFIDRYTFLN
jgi:hypothetical protein